MLFCIHKHVINVDFRQSKKGKDFNGIWNFLDVFTSVEMNGEG